MSEKKNKTKEVICELFQHYSIESIRSKDSRSLVRWLIIVFGISRGVAYNVKNKLKTYSLECLFFMYFERSNFYERKEE